MSTSKHPSTPEWGEGDGPPDDLERNPRIGSSKGLFAMTSSDDAELIEGDNTFEGDTDNDGGNAGGISTKLGRDH